MPYLMLGDVIRVIDDLERVHELQRGHPGWLDDMALVCVLDSNRSEF